MKKITFGTPEKYVPSYFCKNFNYTETEVRYPVEDITFKRLDSGCTLEFPLEDDCHIFGFGLQIKHFDHRGQKLRLDVNADPQGPTGESHAPVPFFVTNKGYGMYFDTARYAEFYCGKQKNQSFRRTESIGGAAGHNCGQIAAAMITLGNTAPLYYLPILLGVSLGTGAVTGLVCAGVFRTLSRTGLMKG